METTILYRSTTINPSIWTILVTLLLSLLLFGETGSMAECPHLCECKWKSGKESVLCLNANLSGIPTKLDAGTQVLDLTRNEIANVANDAFSRANLLNLQKLFLTKCRLKSIERYAFRKLINLVELDLSDNLLNMIPSHAFESTPELRELKLIGNPIQRISNDAFIKVPQLIRLELSHCRISAVEARAFTGLEASLEWLKLDGNKLLDIRAVALISLQNLHGLELAGNPWNCSCSLRPLREWMLRENIPYDIPPVCQYPARLASKAWDKIDLDEYACIPHILAPDVRAHGVEGRNITMSCMVGGVPEPNVRWIVRNRIIANLSGNTKLPASQGRKLYMVNLQQNASNLTILTAEIQDAGTYICAAENKAGKVEASVTLAISRKPPNAILSAKVIFASIIAFALFVIAAVLAVVCVCTLKRRKNLTRWNTQGRCESYEKIELSNKPNYGVGKSPRRDRNTFMKPYGENGISVVGQVRRNGDYRNVPSEDDGTDCYEDNIESSNATISNMKIDNVSNWNVASASVSRCAKNDSTERDTDGVNIKPLKLTQNDLHIPRLIEFSDSTPDCGPNSCLDQYDMAKRSGSNLIGNNYNNNKAMHHTVNRKRMPSNTNIEKISYTERSHGGSSDGRTSESDCDNDKKYPDLLYITSLCTTTTQSAHVYSQSNSHKSAINNPFCTLPRKKHSHLARHCTKPTPSESQSPLLTDSSSRYGSSTFADCDLLGRRLSSESFSNYHPPSIYTQSNNSNNGRSNSFLNLVAPQSNGTNQSGHHHHHHHKRNPSLPSSPSKVPPTKLFSPAETPLLDFSTWTMRKQQLIATPSPSTSTTTASAYDYHAAQLERFLEEYRNLQEQLCKMKETCDSIRKKEAPLRGTAGNSVKLADPVMYTAAALSGGGATTSLPINDGPTNPKSILKNKILLPGQPPDPPPYWLHRNAMLKRLQDPGADFFQS